MNPVIYPQRDRSRKNSILTRSTRCNPFRVGARAGRFPRGALTVNPGLSDETPLGFSELRHIQVSLSPSDKRPTHRSTLQCPTDNGCCYRWHTSKSTRPLQYSSRPPHKRTPTGFHQIAQGSRGYRDHPGSTHHLGIPTLKEISVKCIPRCKRKGAPEHDEQVLIKNPEAGSSP